MEWSNNICWSICNIISNPAQTVPLKLFLNIKKVFLIHLLEFIFSFINIRCHKYFRTNMNDYNENTLRIESHNLVRCMS